MKTILAAGTLLSSLVFAGDARADCCRCPCPCPPSNGEPAAAASVQGTASYRSAYQPGGTAAAPPVSMTRGVMRGNISDDIARARQSVKGR